jgi:zinc protease
MPRRWIVFAAGALLASAGSFAQDPPASPVSSLKLEHYELVNGMKVIFYVDRRAPVVHVNLRFYVGSRDERPGRTGFAHLFEHMMFEGADAKSNFNALAAEVGATESNAATGMDGTEYYETVPRARLERMLWLESNRFANLPNVLNQERLDNQRDVVRNELREKVENRPYARYYGLAFENLFPAGHPYAHDVVGTHQDLMEGSLADVRAFYFDYYTPDNLCLMLAGDFDPAQAKTWIARYFGSWAPGSVKARPPRSTPQLSESKLVEIRDHVPDERIYFTWVMPGMFDPDEAALEIAEFVLNSESGMRSTKERKDVESVEVGSRAVLDASLFTLTVTAAQAGLPVAEVDKAVTADLARLAQEGPTEEQLAQARNQLEFDMTAALEDLHDVAFYVQNSQQYFGTPDRYGEWMNRFSRVTAAAVKAAVARWLTPNRLIVHFTRETARHDETPEPNRKQAPPYQTEQPYGPPELKSARLSNGLQVLVMERHPSPLVAVELRFKLGPDYEPPGKGGLAVIAMATLGTGTPRRTKEEIDKEKTRLALEIHGNVDGGSQTAGLVVLRKNLEPALDLLGDLIRNANYPSDAFESAKKRTMDQFEKTGDRIDDYAGHVVAAAFGPQHPLGNLIHGTRESRRTITAKDAADFKNLHWKPDGALLAFAGDIGVDDAVAMAKKHFGDWIGSAGPPAAFPAPQPMPGRLFLVDRPGATQTMVVQVLPGIPRDSPEYPALVLLDRVWGKIDGSRLNQQIREEQGIAYYANSEMFHFPGYGLWVAKSLVQADKTRQAMLAFTRELRGLAEKPVTARELEVAKSHVLNFYLDQFTKVWPTVDLIASNWAAGLPPDDLRTLPQRVAAVTLEQVNAAARKYARPERAFFLLLGDREKIGTDFRDLAMGELKVIQ